MATAEPICEAVKEVRIAKADVLTKGTAGQILANNEARKALCSSKG